MAELYADEQFPRQVVEFLRVFGHDVLTVQEAGQANLKISDLEVLAFAIQEKRAILTLNLLGYIPRRSAAKNIRMSEYIH
jgi:predicted nuclease of predicted toxin-antitoxin system